MRCLILAGGYGTRMQGILGDIPKALADIQGQSVLDRLLDGISPIVSQVSLVSNTRFYPLFEAWQRQGCTPCNCLIMALPSPITASALWAILT